jgi:hypothetical protein
MSTSPPDAEPFCHANLNSVPIIAPLYFGLVIANMNSKRIFD